MMSEQSAQAWSEHYAAKATSEAQHGYVECWADSSKHPWGAK